MLLQCWLLLTGPHQESQDWDGLEQWSPTRGLVLVKGPFGKNNFHKFFTRDIQFIIWVWWVFFFLKWPDYLHYIHFTWRIIRKYQFLMPIPSICFAFICYTWAVKILSDIKPARSTGKVWDHCSTVLIYYQHLHKIKFASFIAHPYLSGADDLQTEELRVEFL